MNYPTFTIPKRLFELQNKLFDLRKKEKLLLQNGDIGFASAPSNIALIKYWGKSETQFQTPDNPSLSFTLENFRSNTQVTVLGRFFPENETPNFIPKHEFYLTDTETQKENNQILSPQLYDVLQYRISSGSQKVSNMSEKLNSFITNILFPFATDIGLKIESHNNFPTACGMASSASGMAALCGAIANLLNLEKHFSKSELQYWLEQWSRLGSGSATRSACLQKNAKFVSWELDPANDAESTIKNIPYHKKWDKLRHCVFVLDANPKKIKSSEGHLAAHTSPLHSIRVNNIKENFFKFKKSLKDFDFEYVSAFTENDALAMHAVMQTSTPPALYLNQQVSFIISEFIQFRQKEKIKAFWTLDAGPNIHFLYLAHHHKKLMKFYKKISMEIKLTTIYA